MVEPERSYLRLGSHTEYIVETDRRWSIEEVSSVAFKGKWIPSRSDVLNFGLAREAYWFRFQLVSELEQPRKLMFEIPHPVLDHIEYYAQQEGGGFEQHTVGDLYPHGNKIVRHYHFIFPIQLAPGQSRWIYFRVQTKGSLQVPLNLWTPEDFVAHTQDEQLLYGILSGFLMVMIFYNLFVFFVIRDPSYLYYVLFVLSVSLFEGTILGLPQEYLWPSNPWLAEKAYCWGGMGNCLFIALFTVQFMNLSRLLPVWHKIFRPYIVVSLAGILATPLVPYRYMVMFLAGWSALGVILFLVLAVFALMKGFKPARYYLAAWAIYLVGVLMYALNRFDLIPRATITELSHLVGLALNAVLLSLALADRINVLRQEKEQMQRQALEVQRRAAETLEQEVQNRTQELKQAYESLAEHDRLKSRFFANVSHEVRTPLTLILTPLQRLLAGDGDSVSEGTKNKLRAVVGNVQRLLRLVNQLLDFSRLESGGTTVSFEQMNIGEMVESIVTFFEGFAQGKGIKLHLIRPEQLPEVYVDPPKLDKVVSNLLANACKFTEHNGKVVVRLTSDERTLRIEVTDTGIGIPDEELPHIFERFRQVDGSASRKHEGTGIGLALSKELVALLGGELEVQSKVHAGSTFTVILPLGTDHIRDPSQISTRESQEYDAATAQEAAAALTVEVGVPGPVADSTEGPATPGEDVERPLVLVVEDNPDMRSLIREICQGTFVVMEAEDGRKALEQIQRRRPALVISDIMMPVMDGYELVRQVRADPDTESLPVLLLTAKAGPEMLAEGLEAGANDYLAKPFETQELLARARNLVRLEQQDRQLRQFNERLQEELVGQAAALERARMLERYVSPSVARSILEGEQPVQVAQQRLRLTVFLLELRGFDGMAEDLEPEEMTAMLNGYLSSMMDVALDSGATVDRLNQDVVGGFFGAPTSEGPEQDAIRCARMARQMWQRAVEICLQWKGMQVKVPPTPTMVLVSGFATVGNFGSSKRLEYTAIGTPVNQAQTLLSRIRAGTVACVQSTWYLIQKEIEGELYETLRATQGSKTLDLYRIVMPHVPGFETMNVPLITPPSSGEGLQVDEEPHPMVSSGEGGISASQDPKQLKSGTVVGKRYTVTRRLGSGGMGVVYQVLDLKLDATVALKLIVKDLQKEPHFRKRLYREVKLARLITHPNVARIFDLDEWQGHEFITMEYIDGETLSSRLRQGALELEAGLEMFRQICAGLAAAHVAGIVHRDLKPSNIMLEQAGRVTIMDFGIARWASSVLEPGAEVTLDVSGTPQYMAPEQFKGAPADPRTEIYALGCVAYAIFTGRRAFEKGDLATMCQQHTQLTPRPPAQLNPKIPPRLSAIIMRCLMKEPADRFSRVDEIAALLSGDPASWGTELAPSQVFESASVKMDG